MTLLLEHTLRALKISLTDEINVVFAQFRWTLQFLKTVHVLINIKSPKALRESEPPTDDELILICQHVFDQKLNTWLPETIKIPEDHNNYPPPRKHRDHPTQEPLYQNLIEDFYHLQEQTQACLRNEIQYPYREITQTLWRMYQNATRLEFSEETLNRIQTRWRPKHHESDPAIDSQARTIISVLKDIQKEIHHQRLERKKRLG